MGTVRYTTVDGEVIAEKRAGVRRQYVPDSLGSTVALLDNSQAQTDTFQYWPYGEEAARVGTTATPFRFVGTLGYHQDGVRRSYVRARHLDTVAGRWMSEDPFLEKRHKLLSYVYVRNNPCTQVDYSGLWPTAYTPKCLICAGTALRGWWNSPWHFCNHKYMHCLTCCLLERLVGGNCAIAMQELQPDWGSGAGERNKERMEACGVGLSVACDKMSCSDGCLETYPWPTCPGGGSACKANSPCQQKWPDFLNNPEPAPISHQCKSNAFDAQ